MFKKKKNKEETKKEDVKNEEIKKLEEKSNKNYIKAHLIFEVVGKPADFIEEIIKKLLNEFEKERGLSIIEKSIGEAKTYKIKENQEEEKSEFFSTFAEVVILIESLKRLIEIIFDYMPSSIEIFEPEKIDIKIQDLNLLLNELATKLHQYDLSNKKLVFQRNLLFDKLKDLQNKMKNNSKEKSEEK